MSALQVIRRIELPLAVPTIMAGGANGRGEHHRDGGAWHLSPASALSVDLILGGMCTADEGVVAGAILIAFLTLTLELSLAGLQWLLTPKGMKLARAGAAA